MSDEASAADTGAGASDVPVAAPVPEVVEVTEAMPLEIAQEISEAIPDAMVQEVVPEIEIEQSGEVEVPLSSAELQTPPPQPAASAATSSAPPPPPAPQLQSPQPVASIIERRAQALEKRQSKKRANLDKIVQFVAREGSVKNDQVEKLLHVSNATATRYLMQLVREGKLQKVGSRRGAHYVPV